MTEREALKLALEALENLQRAYREAVKLWDPNHHDAYTVNSHSAIADIREALAQPEQEPVVVSHSIEIECQKCGATEHGSLSFTQSPPQRKPLTDAEIKRIAAPLFMSHYWNLCKEFARAIEAAHGIFEDKK